MGLKARTFLPRSTGRLAAHPRVPGNFSGPAGPGWSVFPCLSNLNSAKLVESLLCSWKQVPVSRDADISRTLPPGNGEKGSLESETDHERGLLYAPEALPLASVHTLTCHPSPILLYNFQLCVYNI